MTFDASITQRVRAALIDAGHPDLAIETISEAVRELESEIYTLKRDVKLLQDANRERKNFTDSGVWRTVKAKLDEEAVDWVRWAIRGVLGVVGATLIGVLLRVAWKGFTRTP